MKKNVNNLVAALFSSNNRSKIFYILAFVPFVLMFYFSAEFHFASVVTLYGYIILVIKKPKLFSRPEGSAIQKVFGLVVALVSFFVYYVLSPFFPNVVFYGFANYSLYIIGLFLLFFNVKVLKEALSPLFLVGASFLGSFFSDLAKSYFEVYLPNFTSFIASILRAIGIATQHPSLDPNAITMLYTLKGPISLWIGWGCVGFVSMFIFSVILIVIMLEDPSSTKTKVIWSILGVSGTFFVNLIRIVTIFVGFYFYGYDFYKVHLYLGYILFIMWSVIFFYLFSKRNVISQKIRMKRAHIIERSIVQDKNLLYTITSYSIILAIFMNLNSLQSPLIGWMASIIYFMINAVFLGNAFFEKENAFFRLMFGALLLIMLLGFVGWLILIIYNLDVTRVTLLLVIVGTSSSLLNRRMKHRNASN